MDTFELTLEPVEIVAGRFQLRPPSARDAEDALAIALDSAILQWNPMPGVADLDAARAWCERWADWDGGTRPQFCVYDAVEGRLLGNVGVSKIDVEHSQGSIGYRVAPWARGRGVATTAVRAVADWAFGALELTRLELMHSVGNVASCRVAEKAGFRLEGTTRSSFRNGDGRLHDEHIHGRLASDPLPR